MKRPPELKTITPQAVIDFLPASIPEQLGVLDMCVQWLREDSEVVTQARMSEAKKHPTLTAGLSVANHKAAKLADDLRLLTRQSRAAKSKWDAVDADQQITETPAMRAAAADLTAAQQDRDRIEAELQQVKTRITELEQQAEEMDNLRRWCFTLIERQAALLRGEIIMPNTPFNAVARG